jgi:hypothetical protein
MAAKIHVTGPAHVYCGHKGDLPGAGLYLGTCEKSPDFETEFKWGDILNDIAGGAPIDLIFKGMLSKLDILLSRFNEANVLNFAGNANSRVKRGGTNALPTSHQPGITDSGQIGSLSEYSHASVVNSGYWLALMFEFGVATPTAIDPAIPKGYYFPSVFPSSFSYAQGAKSSSGGNGSLGTNAKKVALGIEAHASVVQPGAYGVSGAKAGMTSAGDYVLRLYSTDPTVFDFNALPTCE